MSSGKCTDSNKQYQNGTQYEHLLLVSLTKKAHELSKSDSRFKNFAIGREVNIGYRKLDDVVFRYEANDDEEKPKDEKIPKRKFIFGQIKHKKNNSLKINYDSLTKAKMSGSMGDDFNLLQYFISFRTIREELENEENKTLSEQFKNGKIKYIAIFTNVGIDKEHLEDKGCSLKEAPTDIKDLFTQETNHFHQFGNVSDDIKNTFKKSSDLHIIAREFAHFVVSKKYEQEKEFIMGSNKAKYHYIIKKYHVALGKEVITKTERKNSKNEPYYVANFKEDFVYNVEPGSKQKLRDAIFEAIEQLDESKKDFREDELKDILRKAEWKVDSSFGGNRKMNLPDKWIPVLDEDIDDFLECLVFSVNQPNVIDLLTQISSEKGKNFFFKFTPGGEALDIMDEKFKDRLLKALGIPRRKENWITGKQIEEFVEEQQEALNCFIYTLLNEDKVMQYGEFKRLGKISASLDSFLNYERNEEITKEAHLLLKNSKVFCICTTVTLLTTVKILQYLNDKNHKAKNGQIFIKLDDLKSEKITDRVEKAFKSENQNLLMIECKGAFSEKVERIIDLYYRFSNIIKDNPNKKIILIIEEKNLNISTTKITNHLKEFLEKHKQISNPFKLCVHETDEIIVKDFKPKEDPFTKKIIVFQGQNEEISLATLTGIPNWESYVAESSPKGIQNEEDIIDAITLVEILKSENIVVGSELEGTYSLECTYASLPENIKEVDRGILNKKLSQQGPDRNTDAIYIVSGIEGSNENAKISKMFNNLGLINIKAEIIEKQLGDIGIGSRIKLTDDKFKEEDFKDICHRHPEKKIFWICVKQRDRFFLQKFYNPNFYLKREFKKIIIKKEVKELLIVENLSENFVFSCDDIHFLNDINFFMESLGLIDESEKRKLKNNYNESTVKLFTSEDDAGASSYIQEICKEYKTIHWLKCEENLLVWCSTHGSVSKLREYIDHEESKTASVQEENLVKQIRYSQTVIIVGDPGMGKTVELTKFYEAKSFINAPWVIRINLRYHELAIKNIKTENRITDVVNFISEVDSELNNSLSKSLLKNALRNNTVSKPLLLVVDGFDEVFDNEYRNNIISLLKFIKEETPSKLWVSSRRHYKDALEKGLSAFATELNPMNDDSAIAYIQEYLRDRDCLILAEEYFAKNDGKQKNKSVQKYAEAFLKKVKSIFEDDMSEFVGTPLLFHLMLKDSEIHFENWIVQNVDQNLTFNYLGDDVQVYEKLIKGMCDFSREKYRKDKIFWKEHETIFLQYRKKVAKCLIFKTEVDEIFEELNEKDIQDIVFLTGIIKSDGSSIEFFPSKLKYFFAAEWCVNVIRKRKHSATNEEKNEHILKVILKKRDYKQIRSIINVKLHNVMETKEFEKCLKYYGSFIEKLLRKEESALIDEEGTPLHNAAAENNINIAYFLLNSLKEHTDVLQKFLFMSDKDNRTALHIAVAKRDINIASFLLNNLEEHTDVLQKFLFMSDKDNRTALHIAVAKRDINIASFLLNKLEEHTDVLQKFIFMSDKDNRTALHIAVAKRDINIVSILLNNLEEHTDVLQKFLFMSDKDNRTALHIAVAEHDITIVSFLLNNLKEHTDVLQKFLLMSDKDNRTALHIAVAEHDISIAFFLLNSLKGYTGVLKKFLFTPDKDKRTALDLARSRDDNEIVKLLSDAETQLFNGTGDHINTN